MSLNWQDQLLALVEQQPALRHQRQVLLPKPGRGIDPSFSPSPDRISWQTYAVTEREVCINSGNKPLFLATHMTAEIYHATQIDSLKIHTHLELLRATTVQVDFYLPFGDDGYMLMLSSYNQRSLELSR